MWQSCLPLDAGRGGPGTATPVSVIIMSWELQPERDRCRGAGGGGRPAGSGDHAESCDGARVWERREESCFIGRGGSGGGVIWEMRPDKPAGKDRESGAGSCLGGNSATACPAHPYSPPYHLPCTAPFLPAILLSGGGSQGLPQALCPSNSGLHTHRCPYLLSLPPNHNP